MVGRALNPHRFLLIKQAESNQRLAHVCGTCRFGDDAQSSVLDANNKAHDLENLYIVDGSFLPSSGGTNPALTIAANALRVADYLIAARNRAEIRV
jgi:choline dehydrogenase-like flavoprotein